ncbi:carboxypeptidase-like regulatory domain-containing protein [Arsukibacterium indicum]|nr:carboxypeptidase-like regulatory domain-containing protein [Arsukibacterium indicum]
MAEVKLWRLPTLLLVLSVIFLTIFSQQVMADMFSWLKKYDVHLSPPVRGIVTLDGKPVAGAQVMRELTYDSDFIDKTVTAADGSFSFPEKNIRSRKPGSLQEMRTRQVISLQYQNKPYLLWYLTTSSITPQQAIVQKLSSLQCDLNNEELEQVFTNYEKPDFPHSTFSICRWNDELLTKVTE